MRLASLGLVLALGLAACTDTPTATTATPSVASVPAAYGARVDTGPGGQPVDIAAINVAYLNERTMRQRVAYNGGEAPGTIVVDPYARVLYHVMAGGEAMRYGVAVGKAGKGFSGTGTISRKERWPSWTPTANMVRNDPELYGPVSGGLAGGIQNPLGSRALYLYKGGRDTMFRIHGTMDPSSIGKATSAGCIRLFNQDVLDLFDQITLGTQVKVRSQSESLALEGPMVETPEGYLVPAGAQAPVVAVAAAPVTTTTAVVPVVATAPATVVAAQGVPVVVSPVESAVPTN